MLSPNPRSVRLARCFVADCLCDTVGSDALEVAVLLTSELVSNAVLHGGPHGEAATVRLSVEHDNARLRVEVEDANPSVPVVREVAPTSIGGRGLAIVQRLADRWGCEPAVVGKVVWFEVVESPAAAAELGDPDD